MMSTEFMEKFKEQFPEEVAEMLIAREIVDGLAVIDLGFIDTMIKVGRFKKVSGFDWSDNEEWTLRDLTAVRIFAETYRELIRVTMHEGQQGECASNRERTASDTAAT